LGIEIITAIEAHFKDSDYEGFEGNEKFA
jgi:C-terminal processing protease CtpA/Prc